MMRSLYSAVSGLKAHQTRMDVIGNNIANVNTVAYKSQSMTFSEVFYQTTQTASGPNAETGKGGTNAMQIGLGSQVGAISTSVKTEGAAERTDNPFDLKIAGDAFFIVSNAGNTYFTRAGNFTVDSAGALVTAGGANVMGWQVDADGNVVKDLVSPLYVTSPEFTYTTPERTTGVTMTGNINASSTDTVTTTMNFFDSLGNSYQATVNLVHQGTAGGDGTVTNYGIKPVSISKNGNPTNLTFETDANGFSGTMQFNSITGLSLSDNSHMLMKFAIDPDAENVEEVDLNTVGASATASEADRTIQYIDEATGEAVEVVLEANQFVLDTSGITMYADKTALKSASGYTDPVSGYKTKAGKAVGKMTSVGIDNSGCIVASYSNGDTKTIGQIAVTSFANPEGLEKVGENLYSATLNSGNFDGIGVDVTSTDGSISSGVLEMSNVDLSAEFTKMITTQRGFQANSRIITVSDTLLEELINLKR